jgi:hypothetical protein
MYLIYLLSVLKTVSNNNFPELPAINSLLRSQFIYRDSVKKHSGHAVWRVKVIKSAKQACR